MILVCGDAMVDRYVWGDVDRISPEAPVPVVNASRIEERPGGAANVLLNVRALGGKAEGLYSSSYAHSPVVKVRIIGRHQQMLRIDFDMPQEPIEEALFKQHQANIVIFSDYGKGSLSNIQNLIAAAEGCTILVDPRGFDYSRYRGAHLIKPNVHEMQELVGGWRTEEQLAQKAEALRVELGLRGILLTRAAAGMTLFSEAFVDHVSSKAPEVYDVSGAGDTAIAAFAVALAKGHNMTTAMMYANKAAGIVVGRFGTAVATEEEVFG